MNTYLFLLLLFGLQIACFFLGIKKSKGQKGSSDYFLAGRSVGFFPLMMTFIATQVGGGLVLGACEEAYKYGFIVLLYPLGATLGLILLGLGMGRKLHQMRVSTIAELFEIVYESKFLRKFASMLSVLSLYMILAAQFIASHKFMKAIGVENELYFILFWTIVIVYTAFGGLKAVIATDLLQAGFFILSFLFCLGFVCYEHPSFPVFNFEPTSFDSSKLVGWLFMPLLFMLIEQDMGQRCLGAKNQKTVTLATIGAAVATLFICSIPVLFGVLAKCLNIEIQSGSSVFMSFMVNYTNPALTALMATAILVAIISTADSLINAIGSNLGSDFGGTLKLKTSQVLAALIGISGIFFSYYFDNIVDLLIQSYELSISALFVSIFACLFKKRGHKISAGLSISFGFVSFFLFRFLEITNQKELTSVALSFLGYLIGEWMVYKKFSLLPRKTKERTLTNQ
jgi:SSS family solute:Na+ symporter